MDKIDSFTVGKSIPNLDNAVQRAICNSVITVIPPLQMLMVPTKSGVEPAFVGDTINAYDDGSFEVVSTRKENAYI